MKVNFMQPMRILKFGRGAGSSSFAPYFCFFAALSFMASCAVADMGGTLADFESIYGASVQTRPTPTGNIAAFKLPDKVIMAEFGSDGRARNVAYRTKSQLTESMISEFLAKSSPSTGSFYRVDMPKLSSTLDYLSRVSAGAGGQDVPPEVAQFAQQLNPQVVAQLKGTLGQISDLRATHDGKYIAMIDPRGSVMVIEINGPMLPLAE